MKGWPREKDRASTLSGEDSLRKLSRFVLRTKSANLLRPMLRALGA